MCDPKLCIFGGAEIDPEKPNLIGLNWSDFISLNLFGIADETSATGNWSNSNDDSGILEVRLEDKPAGTPKTRMLDNDLRLQWWNKSGMRIW